MQRCLIIAVAAALWLAPAAARANSSPRVVQSAVAPHPSPRAFSRPTPLRSNQEMAAAGEVLDKLIGEALKLNPDLIAKRAETRVQYDKIAPAGMPADPQLGFQLKDMPTTFSFTREGATQKQIIAQASYPFPGKLTLRRNVAEKQAELSREELHAGMQRLVTQVRSAFADVFVADKDIQVETEHQARLVNFAKIAAAKYRLGPGLQQDVLNADAAVAASNSRLIELRRERLSRVTTIAALLNRDRVTVPPLGALPDLEPARSEADLERVALVTNPAILSAGKAVERDRQALALARKSALPDFSVRVIYGSRNDFTHPETGQPDTVRPDLMRGEVMMTMPVFYFQKQRHQIDEAAADLTRSGAKLASARRMVIDGLEDLFDRLNQHREVAESYRNEVIPLAQTAVAASVSAYRVDKVDFLTMLKAQDTLDQDRAQYWRERAEVFRDGALIQEAAGVALPAGGGKP